MGEMNDLFGFVSIIVTGCGIYALYAYVMMRKNGTINEVLLLGKNYTERMCKDKEGFLKKALPAVLAFAAAAILYGVVDVIHCYVTPLKIIDPVCGVIFMAVLVWYMVYTTKLKKEYF